MLFWLIAGLAVYLASVYLPAALYIGTETVATHVASRDELPEEGKYTRRARRALANLQENLPIFLTLGILALVVPEADMDQATLGAQIFVIARVAYVVAYMISIPYTRSTAYTVGLIGNIMMLVALI